MTKELQTWCQDEIERLLKQKEILLSKKSGPDDPTVTNNPDLPHYKTMLQLFQNIEEKELFLLEIKDKIKTLERKNELDKLRNVFSSIRLQDSYLKETSTSAIQEWLKQIRFYNKQNNIESDNSKFYDVAFSTTEGKEFLTWSTLYKGRCTRVTISACVDCKSCDPVDYDFSSSFYVEGLVSKGKEYICSSKNVEDYVSEVLWKGLQELIDIS